MLLICTASNGKNLTLARRLAELSAELGIDHEVLDVVALDWPMYTPVNDLRQPPPWPSAPQ